MKRCVYLFLLSILLVAGLTACGSGKAEQEVPSLTEIEGMTNDEAAEALSGFCRQDILDAWGKPGGGLSGQAGGKAVARILTGAVCPSGKTSETYPLSFEDNPTYGNYPGQPVVKEASAKTRFRHYVNLHRTEARIRRLLADFKWARMDKLFLPASAAK